MKLRKKRFTDEVLSGHKESAIEVPFDPMKEWNILPRSLWRGRRGHPVKATVNGFSFESAIVSRQKRFYLLIDAEAATSVRLAEGVSVDVVIEPWVGKMSEETKQGNCTGLRRRI